MSMKLEEYVKQTLLAITNGVEAAQRESKLFIAPGRIDDEIIRPPQMATFEVTITATKDAGGSISVWSFGDLKAGGNSAETNKISFEVPVYFQLQTPLHPKQLKKAL